MERKISILGSIGKDGRIILMINEQTIKLDAKGYGELDVNDMVVSGEKSVYEYDRALDNIIGKSQKMELYELFVRSSRFGQGDVADFLVIERKVAKQILVLGFKNKVLSRCDTQWKLELLKRDQIVQFLKSYVSKDEDKPEAFIASTTEGEEVVKDVNPSSRKKKEK